MKVRLSEYGTRTYSTMSRPHPQTLRKMAERGDIPGAHQDRGGRWWVELGDTGAHGIDSRLRSLIGDDPELASMFG